METKPVRRLGRAPASAASAEVATLLTVLVTVFASVLPLACADGAAPAPTSATTTGTPATPAAPAVDAANFPEYLAGTAPLIIIAPHGGDLTPSAIPDRTCAGCETANDLNTQDLARLVADAFELRTGRRPHLVINRLHRRKFDANRDLAEATAAYSPLEPVWRAFHDGIDSAKARVVRATGRGLVVDLHGHAHAVPRLELGYLLSAATLRLSDSALAARGDMRESSFARLAIDRVAALTGPALLRGSASLGALLVAAGYPSVPSPQDPAPLTGQSYFDGGYNTNRHGSLVGGPTDAVQVECNFDGVRDTAANRARFADALAAALDRFLRDHYGWRP